MRCKIPAADLTQRLDHTICMYKDFPYYVRVNGEALKLFDMVDTDTLVHLISPDDPFLDVATPPLGYSQLTPVSVVYLSRKPHRKFKQGIDFGALQVDAIPGSPFGGGKLRFHSTCVRKTIVREYPSLRQCLKKLEGNLKNLDHDQIELAISPDCAVVLTRKNLVKVFYQQTEVGYINTNDLGSTKPTVIVPNSSMGWIISQYLQDFAWNVE